MRALLYRIRRAFLSGNLISHYFLNKSFRVNISLLVSLILNLVYLIFNLVSGIKYGSIAFIGVSVYYALHISIRYKILNIAETGEDKETELQTCKKGGILLLAADVLIAPMLIFGAFSGRSPSYSLPMLLFLGFYAACAIVSASVGIAVSKRERRPARRAAYSVRLASSAVSVFNLSTALVSSFLCGNFVSEALSAALGAAVSLFVLYLSLTMIFHS